ncbi:hypothetical protein CDV36_012691 [Fusarium kuroshium]|uniref:Uncharacterized protein n=1 Tax=Fusarium kuroshium TaxID=2010991 RepID=A0A3M2RQX5_9HYPO|nr:hypothetical protein CDV36_012691 [Fusarium kuroshium]
MSSHQKFILFPQSLPAPELKRAFDQASRFGHQQIRGTVRHSSLPVGQIEQRNLADGHRRRRTTISNAADQMSDVDARLRLGGQVSWSRDPQLFPDPVPAKIGSSSARADRERGHNKEPRSRKRRRAPASQNNPVDWNDGGRPSHLSRDEGLSHAGSWCHLTPRESIEVHDPVDDEKDILTEDWTPMTPRDSRLSTPDLAPLCTDFEFCSCHPNGLDEDKINEDFYFVSRSKMDMQLIEAQAHIAQTRSGSGSGPMVLRDE